MIDRLCIIGVGLIGGSLALALRRANHVKEIVGTSRRRDHLQTAVDLGVIDRFDLDTCQAVDGADVVVLAVPLGAIQTLCEQIKPAVRTLTVLTDVGSSKASVVQAVEYAFGILPAGFVPGHPIAGTEKSGVEAAYAELYQDRRVVLTPVETTSEKALKTVHDMWEATGAIVEEMSVEHHDQVLAATSHLPHMLAFGLVDSLARMSDHDEIFGFAAGGFRDFTRIASSDPTMWADICIANRAPLLTMIARYQDDLAVIRDAIERRDGETLLEIFTRAKQARDRFISG
jgi:prephenate dehydrogenase